MIRNFILGATLLAAWQAPYVDAAVETAAEVAVASGPGPYNFDCDAIGQQFVHFLAQAPAARVTVRGALHFEKRYYGTEWAPLAAVDLLDASSSLEVTLQAVVNGEFTRVELYTDVPKTTDSRKLLLMTPLTYRYIPFSITMNANGTVSESVGANTAILSAGPFSASRIELTCLTAHVKFRDITVTAAP
jgi:hypothetical protein